MDSPGSFIRQSETLKKQRTIAKKHSYNIYWTKYSKQIILMLFLF